MYVIEAGSVDDAYERAILLMSMRGELSSSRNGDVLSTPFPVTTAYRHPQQRVILNQHRDANPFFHFFESLWMLQGRNDATWLDTFVSDFSSRYAEADGTQYGAYGHRWRHQFTVDQLEVVIERLRHSPSDRRVVIQMWDTDFDLWPLDSGLQEPRDIPCNTQIYPRIVSGRLDITVTCRSNDVVWGAYGANAVHFSMLHEYLSGRIDVPIGTYYQMSNNWHLYTAVASKFQSDLRLPEYPGVVNMGTNWEFWDLDLDRFMVDPDSEQQYSNEWFYRVARPMWRAHGLWKSGDKIGARQVADTIAAPDWRLAVVMWMDRRITR